MSDRGGWSTRLTLFQRAHALQGAHGQGGAAGRHRGHGDCHRDLPQGTKRSRIPRRPVARHCVKITRISQDAEARLGLATAEALNGGPSANYPATWDSGGASFQITGRAGPPDVPVASVAVRSFTGTLGTGPAFERLLVKVQGRAYDAKASPCPVSRAEAEQLVSTLQAELAPPADWLRGATILAIGGWNALWPVALRALGRSPSPDAQVHALWPATPVTPFRSSHPSIPRLPWPAVAELKPESGPPLLRTTRPEMRCSLRRAHSHLPRHGVRSRSCATAPATTQFRISSRVVRFLVTPLVLSGNPARFVGKRIAAYPRMRLIKLIAVDSRPPQLEPDGALLG